MENPIIRLFITRATKRERADARAAAKERRTMVEEEWLLECPLCRDLLAARALFLP